MKDSVKTHWVNRAPLGLRPYLQLSRLDRPIGYWLLALPGWIGLAFAGLSNGYGQQDLIWALLILIGAIAMRGAGCTYNDIVDQDLDAQVERTALRPLPAGSVSTQQAWIWLLAQCAVGLIVLLCLPRLAQIIALCSIPLVAAYPFMKRITWWPQLWLGLTFNWAVLVAYAAKTGTLSPAVLILYAGLIFWTVGYDTIYACQDIEDDAMIGVKSTARRFGKRVKLGVGVCYAILIALFILALSKAIYLPNYILGIDGPVICVTAGYYPIAAVFAAAFPFCVHLALQLKKFDPKNGALALSIFKSNALAALILIASLIALYYIGQTRMLLFLEPAYFLGPNQPSLTPS